MLTDLFLCCAQEHDVSEVTFASRSDQTVVSPDVPLLSAQRIQSIIKDTNDRCPLERQQSERKVGNSMEHDSRRESVSQSHIDVACSAPEASLQATPAHRSTHAGGIETELWGAEQAGTFFNPSSILGSWNSFWGSGGERNGASGGQGGFQMSARKQNGGSVDAGRQTHTDMHAKGSRSWFFNDAAWASKQAKEGSASVTKKCQTYSVRGASTTQGGATLVAGGKCKDIGSQSVNWLEAARKEFPYLSQKETNDHDSEGPKEHWLSAAAGGGGIDEVARRLEVCVHVHECVSLGEIECSAMRPVR